MARELLRVRPIVEAARKQEQARDALRGEPFLKRCGMQRTRMFQDLRVANAATEAAIRAYDAKRAKETR